jgi:hypothetical protein
MLDHPDGHAGQEGLAALLSAAASTETDLAPQAEESAVAAFRAVAHPEPVPTPGGSTVMTRITRKVAAAPVAALAAVGLLVAGGGVALAASQGAVHVPFTGHDSRPSAAPSAPTTVNPGVGQTHAPSDEATDEAPAEVSSTPSPSLEGLCVAYQAGAMDKASSNSAFAVLQSAAGGADNVAAYCVGLIGERAHPTHPAKPTQAATPSHPAHPAHPAMPTHPAKPTQAATPDRSGASSRAPR